MNSKHVIIADAYRVTMQQETSSMYRAFYQHYNAALQRAASQRIDNVYFRTEKDVLRYFAYLADRCTEQKNAVHAKVSD